MQPETSTIRILVVDDEAPLVELVRGYLAREGWTVLTAADGPSALETVRNDRPDVVVLDLMLPGLNGIEVCRQLRTFSDAYVLMLTAKSEEVDKLVGLAVGADDYLTKPFSPRELVARIRALLRRTRNPSAGTPGLDVDSGRRIARVDGRPIELTRTEFDILAALAREPGVAGQQMDAATLVAFQDAVRTALAAALAIALVTAVAIALALSSRIATPVTRLVAAGRSCGACTPSA